MAWRLAVSLRTLRDEINAWAPNRSKASDGTIGDPAHAARASRHNPNDFGVVCALDVTHDPAGGCDVHALADRLREMKAAGAGHPELAYIVSNRRICSPTNGWAWRSYSGSNPHTLHAHFAVGVGPDSEPRPPYDSTQAWGVAPVAPPPAPPFVPQPPTLPPNLYPEDSMPTYVRGDGPSGQPPYNQAGDYVYLVNPDGSLTHVDAGKNDVLDKAGIPTSVRIIPQRTVDGAPRRA